MAHTTRLASWDAQRAGHRLRKTIPMRRCLVLVLSLPFPEDPFPEDPIPGSSLGAVWMASPTLGPTSRGPVLLCALHYRVGSLWGQWSRGKRQVLPWRMGGARPQSQGMTDHRRGALLNATGNHGQSCGSNIYLALAVHYLGSQFSHLQNGIKSSSCSQGCKRIKE